MSIFSKKWDYKKDYLRLEFILEKQQYVYFYGSQELSYDDLSRRTKKYLDEKNKKLSDKNILMEKIKYAQRIKRKQFLELKGYGCDGFEYLGENKGTMSQEMENFLTNLVKTENILLGIHRVGRANMEKIKDMLENGIQLSGHLGSGMYSPVEISNNVSFYSDNEVIIKELMYADQYKFSIGSILIEIPYNDLEKDVCIIDHEGFSRVNPKYIVGYIPVEENHHISKIVRASDFKQDINEEIDYPFIDYYSDNYVDEEEEHTKSR